MSKKSTKFKAFQDALKENNITLANIEKNDELIRIIKRNGCADIWNFPAEYHG